MNSILLLALVLPTDALHGTRSQVALLKGRDIESSPWNSSDALSVMENTPQGAYSSVMSAVVQAIGLSYNTSKGPDFQPSQVNATILPTGNEQWDRLFDLDLDPSPGGVHARVFADHGNRQAIVAFRGSCLDPDIEQCRLDSCFLTEVNGFGVLSHLVYKTTSEECQRFEGKLDYLKQAEDFVKSVQARLPGYELLLVGHSMGGMLSIVTAALQPKVLKAITFAPTPFHETLLKRLGGQETAVRELPARDLISACDPYDCGINSLYVDQARLGSTTCLYFGTIEPSACDTIAAQPYADELGSWKSKLQMDDIDPLIIRTHLLCKSSAHEWSRYEKLVLRTNADGSPALIPTCKTTFSILQDLELQQA